MAVLQLVRIALGEVGIKPGSVKMISTDNLATITAAGYLNGVGNQVQQGVQLAPSDVIEALYAYNPTTDTGTLAYFQASISNGVVTLVPDSVAVAPLAENFIFVGSAAGVAVGVAMSGDATMVSSGALTIANDAITTAKILNANVTLAKLASGIAPSHVVKFAGQPTTVGGAAAEAFTVTGAAATDLAFVQMVDDGTNNVTIVDAVVTLNTLTVTFSGDPGNNAVINYQLLRAAS